MLKKLKEILPIPQSPIDVDETILQQNIDAIGTDFPEDFLAYSRVYGSGRICLTVYDWEIYSAFRPSFPKFVNRFHMRQDVSRKAIGTVGLELGLYPEPGGLLPFGHSDELYFTWKTEGMPNDWKVVMIWAYEEGGYEILDIEFLPFLLNVLKGDIKVPGFKHNWDPATDISFEPEVYGG